jgi:hypothetical protein
MANAVGLSRNTVTARTQGLDFTHGAHRVRRYRLADALPVIKPRERGYVQNLFELAQNDGEELFVGDNAVQRARRLEGWLVKEQAERLFLARVAFTNALATSVRSSLLFEHLEALRLKLVLTDPVLQWTVLAKSDAFPPFDHWAVPFAITNAQYENLWIKKAS